MTKRNIDHRAVFFWISALASFALVPLTPTEFQWVGETLGVVLILLGCLSLLDFLARRRTRT